MFTHFRLRNHQINLWMSRVKIWFHCYSSNQRWTTFHRELIDLINCWQLTSHFLGFFAMDEIWPEIARETKFYHFQWGNRLNVKLRDDEECFGRKVFKAMIPVDSFWTLLESGINIMSYDCSWWWGWKIQKFGHCLEKIKRHENF